MTTSAITFDQLGREVMRVSSSGDLGIGSGSGRIWRSHQVELGYWQVGTGNLEIQQWLNSAGAGRDFDLSATWNLSPELYTMFLLRWSSDCE